MFRLDSHDVELTADRRGDEVEIFASNSRGGAMFLTAQQARLLARALDGFASDIELRQTAQGAFDV